MAKIIPSLLESVDTLLAWIGTELKTGMEAYCDIETADDEHTLVGHDGSLLSVIHIKGVAALVGEEEFNRIHTGITQSLQAIFSRLGHAIQVYFHYDKQAVRERISDIYKPAKQTAERLELDVADLFEERENYISGYCAQEMVYMVLWTRPNVLTKDQLQRAQKAKARTIKTQKLPPFKDCQNLIAAIPDLRDAHESFVRALLNDLATLNIYAELIDVHRACFQMRMSVDPDFTDNNWRPILPGDKIPIRGAKKLRGDISDLLWPPMAKQLMPRDAENLDLRTVRIGDKIYTGILIDLFPKDLKPFIHLFRRTLPTRIPWRMSFLIDSGGSGLMRFKSTLAAILGWTSAQNRLIRDASQLLNYLEVNTDDAIIKLRVATATWAPEGDIRLLRNRAAQLAKAIEGWGTCEVSEVSGDPFGGVVSSMLGITNSSLARASMAPLSNVIYMLPLTRPASSWSTGAVLFRSPDGKPWPYQPGSSQQTTWIDLFYARPGSGKSVLSNAINLGLCLSGGIQRLPRIAIIDIGPSSSGLISLLKEALPKDREHLAAYHRLRMTPDYAINPFDTQLK